MRTYGGPAKPHGQRGRILAWEHPVHSVWEPTEEKPSQKWRRFQPHPGFCSMNHFPKRASPVTPVLCRVGSSPSSSLLHSFGPPSTDLRADVPARLDLAGLIIKLTKLINHDRLIRVTRWERWHSPNSPIGYACAFFFLIPTAIYFL